MAEVRWTWWRVGPGTALAKKDDARVLSEVDWRIMKAQWLRADLEREVLGVARQTPVPYSVDDPR